MKPAIAALIFSNLLLVGCASTNVYRASARLPSNLRRVAVLPMTCEGGWLAEEGRGVLQPVLQAELSKTRNFELVFLSPEQTRAITGQSEWRSEVRLPADFFARLCQATDCDAVMYCHLTAFRPYPPLAVGWDLKLADARHPQILWSIDEVFDAGDPAVASGARSYSAHHISEPGPLHEPEAILRSPRWFGQYAAAVAFETLPCR